MVNHIHLEGATVGLNYQNTVTVIFDFRASVYVRVCYMSFRLPIVQSGSAAFFSPIFAVVALPEYSCQIGSGMCFVDT